MYTCLQHSPLKGSITLPPTPPQQHGVLGPLPDQEQKTEKEIGIVAARGGVHERLHEAAGEALGRHVVEVGGVGDITPQVQQQLEEGAGGAADAAEGLLPEVDTLLEPHGVRARQRSLLSQDYPAAGA